MIHPQKSEFLRLCDEGNLIPVTRKLLGDFESPLSAYAKIRQHGESFLFESVEGGEHLGRYSFLGCHPRGWIQQRGSDVEVRERGKEPQQFTISTQPDPHNPNAVRDGLEVVEQVLRRYRPVILPGLPRFTGGAVGFIGYEYIHDVEPTVPRPPKDELNTPVMHFLLADEVLIFDRISQTITLLVNAFIEPETSPAKAYDDAVAELDRLMDLLQRPIQVAPLEVPKELPTVPCESNQSKQAFLDNVKKAKDFITAGDIIQVVGSQRFTASITASPLDIYRAARMINPSPYMFLLELEEFSLVGASPEIHVRCEENHVEIRPIAGTRPRGETAQSDLDLEQELLADPKERAEHVMLVDLARNDIGRVCDYGSVQVRDLMIIERYSHVMHIVSQVEGRLAAGKSPYDLMRATFPAGTLTGAPKVRAMQIISEMEQTLRGPYGGCVGYFSFGNNLDCCITIRTALLKDGKAYIQAGGGWVYDSSPEAEFQETVNKSKSMLKAIGLAEQFTAARIP